MTVRAHVYVAKVSLQPRFIGKETRGMGKPMIPQASRGQHHHGRCPAFYVCVATDLVENNHMAENTSFLTRCELVVVTARIS